MTIKKRITIAFTLIVAAILMLFSLFVYFSYEDYRSNLLKDRIYNGKSYLALATAYDLDSYNMSITLKYALVFGNLLALIVIGITAYFFSKKAMSPFDGLIRQIDKAAISDFSFRIKNSSDENEAAVLGKSVNGLLEKIQQLADHQKSFVSYASHELRTPLTIIKGVLQTSLEYDKAAQDYEHSVNLALGEVNHAVELANNLLFLAEMESLRFSVDKKNIDIIDMVMDSIAYINQKYPSQAIGFELLQSDSTNDIQAVTEGIPQLLKSAINNVIDNACKYSDFKPVLIRMKDDKEIVDIEIIDEGIGILQEDLADIFLPMMRGSNTGSINGFGVGLTLVKKIIAFHEGTVTINSDVKKGTTVIISLPVKK